MTKEPSQFTQSDSWRGAGQFDVPTLGQCRNSRRNLFCSKSAFIDGLCDVTCRRWRQADRIRIRGRMWGRVVRDNSSCHDPLTRKGCAEIPALHRLERLLMRPQQFPLVVVGL
jgi:hypothetical protein